MTQLFSFLEFATILADLGFSAKIFYFIFGINQKYLFLFEKFRFTFEFSWVEWYTFQKKVKKMKIRFWRFGTSPDFPWRCLCPKTPEMNVSDPYLISKKNGPFFAWRRRNPRWKRAIQVRPIIITSWTVKWQLKRWWGSLGTSSFRSWGGPGSRTLFDFYRIFFDWN